MAKKGQTRSKAQNVQSRNKIK